MPLHLISQAQQGDHDAFSVLMTERIPTLYRVAGLITGRRDIAEDAVQEALIHAWRDLPQLRDVDDVEDACAVAREAPDTRFAAQLASILPGARAA